MTDSSNGNNINSNNKLSYNLMNSIFEYKNSLIESNKNTTNISIMKEMQTKISNNDYNSLKELLGKNSSTINLKTKNNLLKLSLQKYILKNNKIQLKIITELISNGAEPNYKFKLEFNDKIISSNLSSISNINLTPLIFCCFKGDLDLYEIIKDKVDYTTQSSKDKNYLFFFFENNSNMENKYKIAVDIFNSHSNDIKINNFDNESGMTLLMESVVRQNLNFIKLFLKYGADINSRNLKDGNTALHYAAKSKSKEIIEFLLNNEKINLLIKNNSNKTIIEVFNSTWNDTNIYSLLVKKYDEQKKAFEEGEIEKKIVKEEKEKFTNSKTINNNQNRRNLSSYLEIPIQFVNNQYNPYYDGRSIASLSTTDNQNDVKTNGKTNNIIRYKGTPILNIDLTSEEGENNLILDSLKNDNDNYDDDFDETEKKLGLAIEERNKLLAELNSIKNDIIVINKEIDNFNSQMIDKKNQFNYSTSNKQKVKNAKSSVYDLLLSEENFIKMKNLHAKLSIDENYLQTKFSNRFFDDLQVKSNLVQDILDFYEYNRHSIKKNQESVNKIRSSLQESIENARYEYTLYVIGSYALDLALPWSDLDLILIDKHQNISGKETESKLKEIQQLLSTLSWIYQPILITDYSAFPYITFLTDEKHGSLKVNLTIQDDKNTAYRSIKLIKRYLSAYKNLHYLIIAFKQLFKSANLLYILSNHKNNSKSTLNSYSIILMIIYAIQRSVMDVNTDFVNNTNSLGELFIRFLIFYTTQGFQQIIYTRNGVTDTVNNEDVEYLKSLQPKLIIIDPLNHRNNVSAKTEDINNAKVIMNMIIYVSKVKCDCSCHYLKNYNENVKFVDLGTEHCIFKKICQTAHRINSSL